ncbi:MAG: DNA repair protein RecN [Muribaculaceae bacterium]|nr:DNA repair protein RecN [Muribaculaceae bacterium]
MLETLIIRNYALIDNVSLRFMPGFTIITGETGAGKSIMLGALSLLLGERAETKAISDKSRKSVIEAVFSHPDPDLEMVFEEHGLDWNPAEILVRREISPSGRSRAFVNDSPVTLPVLTAVTGNLVDIHSQHSNILLSQSSSHLAIIDAFCGNGQMLSEYRADFGKYVTLRAKIRKIRQRLEKNRENRDFIAFQLEQLNKINPKEGELRQIEQEFDMLSDADQIREDLGTAYNQLDGGDNAALGSLTEGLSYLSKVNLSLFDEDGGDDIMRRLENVRIELKDISETVRDYLDRVDSDPGRLAKVTSRMNLLYDAMKRFKVADEDALIELHRELESKLNAIDFGDDDVAGLEQEARVLAKELKSKAEMLTVSRKKGAKEFAVRLVETAIPLGLPNLRFDVELSQGKLTADGQDCMEFVCSFNKNHQMQPMAQVASGGETARLMLSIKSIMAKCMNLPTVIFDEVDTGVSGEIADKMGAMMKRMGVDMQVVSITHLPQVAARGDSHFKVYKTDEEERTVSHVRQLDYEERVAELAGMLSGTEVNEAAMMNARSLLEG